MKKLINRCLFFFSVSVLFFAFSAAPAYAATGHGHIYGQLLDGSNKNAPLADQTVTLQMAQGSSASDVSTAKTDAQGNFSFTNLATDKILSYAVYIRYQGAQYTSNVVALDSQPEQKVNLTVYEATKSTQDIAIIQASVLMSLPAANRGVVSMSEAFAIQNLSNHAYVGSFDTSHGKPNALRFSLPAGTKNIALGTGFDGYHVIQVDRGFASDAALLPGNNEFAFSFELPYTKSTYDFSYETIYPTVQLSFLVAPDLHASANILKSGGIVNTNNHSYRIFRASTLPANQTITMHIEGLPLTQTASSPSYNATTIWIVVAIAVMGALVALTWFLYRSRRRGGLHMNGRMAAGETPKRSTALTRDEQQQKLLRELLQLDKDYEAGKLNKTTYEGRRGRTKARLRAIMSERETSRR